MSIYWIRSVEMNKRSKNTSQNRRSKNNKRKDQPNVALYLDELDDVQDNYEDVELITRKRSVQQQPYYREELYDEYETLRARRKQSRAPKRKVTKQKNKFSKRDEKILRKLDAKKEKKLRKKKERKKNMRMFFAILLLINVPMIYGITSAFQINKLATQSEIRKTKGILLLGLDDWIDRNEIDGGHTDSITYLGANFKTKQAVTMPIYRDALIPQTCSGQEENINRIYTAAGINCLTNSVSTFLELPIDYYIIITMAGLISIVNHLGGVELTPTGSFCSNYGEDGVDYCFTQGETRKMKGPETLAYIRYRGATSGEQRANRQMELIMGIKNACMSNIGACYVKVTPFLKNKVQTNIPVYEMFDLLKIFSAGFELEQLGVLEGVNTQIESGWTQFVDENDRIFKRDYIREKVFH